MKKIVLRSLDLLALLGFEPLRFIRILRGLPQFFADFRELKQQFANSNKELPFGKSVPCLEDRFAECGTARGHYFHQDLLVAQWIHESQPIRHVDVGSRIDGLVAHVASFRPIEVLDIRPLEVNLRNIHFSKCDLMAKNFSKVDYADSASCLHALEHFGLGRYNDPVDYYGYLRGWENLYRLLRPGGMLYFSVPIGRQRIEFNGHRVFSLPYLLSLMAGRYQIKRYAYVNDAGDLILDPDLQSAEAANNLGCEYGCGIFALVKM